MKPVQPAPIRMGKPDECIACPVEVRDLFASAHNAVQAFNAALAGAGDWSRAHRKMTELEASVGRFQPIVDDHFSDRIHQTPNIFRTARSAKFPNA